MPISHFRSGKKTELPLLHKRVAAIDLGFGASKTCGIAVSQADEPPLLFLASFGTCVNEIAGLLNDRSIDALVIEAPLSGIFARNGDPCWRAPFEKQQIAGKTATRYWYIQPGSTVCLAAIAFFQRLAAKLAPPKKSVAVFEGFSTFKPKKKSNHLEDACRLLTAARDSSHGTYYEVTVPAEGHLLTALALTGLASKSSIAPAVIAWHE